MNVVILHGDHQVALLASLKQYTKKFDALSTTRVTGKAVDDDFILNNFRGSDLFSSDKLVIIENIDPGFDLDLIPDANNTTLVITANKDLPVTSVVLKSQLAKKAKIEHLSLPPDKTIFTFLDYLGEGNPKAYQLFESLFEDRGDQYLLTMIFFMLRRLLVMPTNLPPSVKQKLTKQFQKLGNDGVADIYQLALDTDYQIKTGKAESKTALLLLCQAVIDRVKE